MSLSEEILEKLISFPTVSSASNLEMMGFIRDYLENRGFEVHTVPDASGRKVGIYASLGPAGAGVMLSGHSDVVPVDGQNWVRDPFRLTRDGNKLYGRGTTDMKGFIACVLALADRAKHSKLAEPLKVAISYDEEIGCVGMKHMIGQLAPSIGLPRACIVGEPTEMQVATGHKGKATFHAVCHGRGGHSAIAPDYLNALHLAVEFAGQVRKIQDDFRTNGTKDPAYDIPYSTAHVGLMSGGTALNMVPEKAELDLEFRHLPTDKAERFLDDLWRRAGQIIEPYQSEFPEANIHIFKTNSYPGLEVDKSSDVVGFAIRLSGHSKTTKVPFGTEAGYFAGLGIPVVVCGPGDMAAQGHQPDEYIERGQLAECDKMLNRVLSDLEG